MPKMLHPELPDCEPIEMHEQQIGPFRSVGWVVIDENGKPVADSPAGGQKPAADPKPDTRLKSAKEA